MNDLSIFGIRAFIQSGLYKELKQLEEKGRILKVMIRDEQTRLNRKRMVWRRIGVMGEFQKANTYEYSQDKLNEFLYDLGLLPNVACIDSNMLTTNQIEKLKVFCVPGKIHVRITPNKFGRVDLSCVADECKHYESMSLQEKVTTWKSIYVRKEVLNKAWEIQKVRSIESDAFHHSKKIAIDTGSLSLLQSPASYKASDVLQMYGSDTLIHCAKVIEEKLDEYAARGFLKKSELKSFRKIIDVQERYILMTLQRESEKHKYWEAKLNRLSIISQ